jgi:hypothetical protein
MSNDILYQHLGTCNCKSSPSYDGVGGGGGGDVYANMSGDGSSGVVNGVGGALLCLLLMEVEVSLVVMVFMVFEMVVVIVCSYSCC